MIWITYGAQSRQLDGKHPHQSRENATVFNFQMETELEKRMPDVIIIDRWWLAAKAQTSDGFHFLLDVNLVKANQLANIMNYLEL